MKTIFDIPDNFQVRFNETVAELLREQNKTLAIAESFTGGAITASLVEVDGISKHLVEGIVAYSEKAKINRLNVSEDILAKFGAVSIETVYEMSANLLSLAECDITVATTGYASGEKAGLCFIAVGECEGVHIFKYQFQGTRKQIIDQGVKAALFHLYKLLKKI
ncbi:MAG: CinA family protein [Firmicutes bacterium]|nr:CinA family protein [Bacillota bacterium]MCL2256312.1 CinA family protein [Bacillota bacterium]